MITIVAKHLDDPLLLEAVQFAISRLSPQHEIVPVLNTKALTLKAGISGEKKLHEVLEKNTFPFEHRIFQNLSLESAAPFQIDALFLTPYYAVIFEVKNISGRLSFIDSPPQLIRTRETGEVDGFESPAAQVERNGELFHIWLQGHGIQLTLYCIVVLAYPKQIVEKDPAKTRVLFPGSVPSFLRSLPRKKAVLDGNSLNKLTEIILQSHKPYIPRPICEMYEISRRDIRSGVACIACGTIGMEKIKRSWRCQKCGTLDHKAHERTVREWFLLIGREMTNKDCREFLHVDSDTAYRIIQSMNLIPSGTYKNRSYRMNF